jgi:hypothetical protein
MAEPSSTRLEPDVYELLTKVEQTLNKALNLLPSYVEAPPVLNDSAEGIPCNSVLEVHDGRQLGCWLRSFRGFRQRVNKSECNVAILALTKSG